MTDEDRRGGASSPSDALAETVSSPAKAGAEGPLPVVGAILGNRYQILGQLGQGAFGAVFRAHDRVADRIVAIKVMSEEALRSPQIVRRVRRELQSAVQVTHPAVVRIHDLFDVDGRLMLSMELIEGGTLADRLHREPRLPAAELLALVDDLTQALAAAHAAGVIHRDLKPANIMLRKANGHAVVTDFGLSRLGHAHEHPTGSASVPPQVASLPLTIEGELMGTPQYMAPEQLIGRDVGAPADLYALGVILFEAATGKRPHEATTIPELYALRTYHPPPALASLRPDLPDWLCQMVDRCLKADQNARYPDGVALRAEIADRYTPPSQRSQPAAAAPPKRKYRAALLLLLFPIVAGGIIVARRFGGQSSGERSVGIVVRNDGASEDAWISAPLARIVAWRIRDQAHGYTVAARSDEASVPVELAYRREAGKVRLWATSGRAGERQARLAEVEGKSVLAAVDQLVEQLEKTVAGGGSERGPDAAEKAEMQMLGTSSFAAYRLFRRAVLETFRTRDDDVERVQQLTAQALEREPQWAHAHALLILSHGWSSPKVPDLLRRAREQTGSSPDASGRLLLEALSAISAGNHKLAVGMLDEQFRRTPQDILIGWALLLELRGEQRVDEMLAVARALHERYPEMQFGSNAANFLRLAGRAAEIPALNRRWLELAPESEEALVSQAQLDIEQGNAEEAGRRIRHILELYGESSPRLATLAELLTLTGDYAEASDMATRLLRGGPRDRARGYNRLGNLAVVQGRFTSAYESFGQASREARASGDDSELLVALNGLQSTAPLVAGPAEIADNLHALEEHLRVMGRIGLAATVRFEREVTQSGRGHCPDTAAAVRDVAPGEAYRIAQRNITRAAAVRGCGRCSDVLRAGLNAEEPDTVLLFDFGLCAEREGANTLASSVFEQIEKGRITSFFHWVLATYHRAAVLEHMNRRADARAAYERFLAHWLHADRSLPEVDGASRALERLR